MREIASAADLTHGALYGHFRSKGQLLVEVIRWKIAEHDYEPSFAAMASDPQSAVELMYEPAGRDHRLLEVDAAAAARHDHDVADGITSLYVERHERTRDSMSDFADPDTAAWIIAALTAGIGMKESAGLPLPDADRLRAGVLAVIRGLGDA